MTKAFLGCHTTILGRPLATAMSVGCVIVRDCDMWRSLVVIKVGMRGVELFLFDVSEMFENRRT